MQLSDLDFDKLRKFIYATSAISLSDKKKALVQSRLGKRIKQLGLSSFKEYYRYITNHENDAEVSIMIDFISTNVTSFFREEPQWNYLRENMDIFKDILKHRGGIKIWSAACSSGQEPYTIAMFLKDEFKIARRAGDIKILATDISNEILGKAIQGEYSAKDMSGLNRLQTQKYFSHTKGKDGGTYRVSDELRKLIMFRQFNLTRGDYAIFGKTKFDIIFCRNVMIYFDAMTRKKLIEEYHNLLNPEGLLFLGHSESVPRELFNKFKVLKSSIYKKV